MPKKRSATTSKPPLVLLFTLLVCTLGIFFFKRFVLKSDELNVKRSNFNKTEENVVGWQNIVACDAETISSDSGWILFSKNSFSLKYPSYWNPNYETQVFQFGDLVTLSYYETNKETFTGGGGFKSRGATLTVAKPIELSSQTTMLDDWIETNVTSLFKRSSGLIIVPNNALTLGDSDASGIYFCDGGGCVNQLFTLINNQIYAVSYSVRRDYEATDRHNFEADLCGILKSIQIN